MKMLLLEEFRRRRIANYNFDTKQIFTEPYFYWTDGEVDFDLFDSDHY
jgi:hypothetical protein